MDMRSEEEVRAWKKAEEERLNDIVDPAILLCHRVVVRTLEGVLDD